MAAADPLPPAIAAQNKGPVLLAVMWTFTALATLFVSARLFTRSKMIRQFGLDDWLILLSMFLSLLFVSLISGAIVAGMGRHALVLEPHQLEMAQLLNAASFAPGLLSFSIPKLAVVALLTKILNPSRFHKIFLWTLSIGSAIFASGCILIFWIQCSPPRALWDLSVTNPKCWDGHILVNYSIFVGVLSALADLYLAVYPATVLYNLQMHKRKKLGLSVALGLGSCACGVTIYKCTRLPGLLDRSDSTYSTSDLFAWTNIESNTIIIAACIPTLQPLLELIFGRHAFGSSSRSRSRSRSRYFSRSSKRASYRIKGSNVEHNSAKPNPFSTNSSTKKPSNASSSFPSETTSPDTLESQIHITRGDESDGTELLWSSSSDKKGIRRTDEVFVQYS